MDALWNPVADAVMRPAVRRPHRRPRRDPRARRASSGESYVDKDLRTLLGQPVRGKFHLRYCGKGDLDRVPRVAVGGRRPGRRRSSRRAQGPDPDGVAQRRPRAPASRPGLIPDTFRATNRPTFQQVLELPSRHGHR